MGLRLSAGDTLSTESLSIVEINQSPVPLRNRPIDLFV